jgi:undecaprenyl-diphosphatase
MVIAGLYIVGLLGGLIEDVLEAEDVQVFDHAINAFFGPWRAQPLLTIFVWITALGAGPTLTAVSIVATGFLWSFLRPLFIVPLWISFLGAQATTWLGKYVIARQRPEFIEAASAMSPSFPSGHATASMALYGFLAYVLARDLANLRARFELAFWAGMLIVAIGFSRIFLSVHYTSDVLAGFLVGAFWLLVGFALSELARAKSAGIEPGKPPG